MDHDEHSRSSPPPKPRARLLAAGLYRRARYELGLTQAQAAERGHCGERSQRDRELGDCSLGALESLVAQANSLGLRIDVSVRCLAANDNDGVPPSLRPGPGLAKCGLQAPRRRKRRAS